MTKLKTLMLCIATAILTVAITFSLTTIHLNIGEKPTLSINGPTSISSSDIAEFRATVTNPSWFTSKTIYQWEVISQSKGVINYRAVSDVDILFPSGSAADKVWVICSAVNYYNYYLWSEAKVLDIKVVPVLVGSVVPPPSPTPTPDPPSPVVPSTVALYGMAVFDSANAMSLTSDQLAVHNGTSDLKNSLKPLNVIWKNYDKAIMDLSWQPHIDKVGTPALFIFDVNGKIYYEGKLAGKTDVVTQVNKLRGIK